MLRRRHRQWLVSLGIFLVLAVWVTWPLARFAGSRLPTGVTVDATVPMLNLWSIWWNADRATQAWAGYWDAPIFHPVGGTFAFSEPQPATLIVAPVLWVTGSRVLAYNVYLLMSLVLNGWVTERVLRRMGIGRWTAIGAGAAMLLLPIVHWQRDVLQLIPIWGILWSWSALLRTARAPSLRRGIETGVALGVTFLMCAHHALLLSVLIGLLCPWLLLRWRDWRLWAAWLAGVAVVAVIVLPVAWPIHRTAESYRFERQADVVNMLSVCAGDYTAPAGRPLVDFGRLAARDQWRLSPGWVKVTLAIIGITYTLLLPGRRRRRRSWIRQNSDDAPHGDKLTEDIRLRMQVFVWLPTSWGRRRWRHPACYLLLTAILAFALSLGMNLRIGGWQPWESLVAVWPGFTRVRSPFRYAYFVQMAVVLLAAIGMHGLIVVQRRFVPAGWQRRVTAGLLIAVGLFAVFEVQPRRLTSVAVPDVADHQQWIDFIRRETPPGAGVLCLPMSSGNQVSDFAVTGRWMYFATFHHQPLVNGYSGFFPAEYFQLRNAVNESFPTESILHELASRNIAFVVCDQSSPIAQRAAQAKYETILLEPVWGDPVGVTVYALRVKASR